MIILPLDYEDLLQLQQFPVLVCEIYKLKSDYRDKFLLKCNIMKFYYLQPQQFSVFSFSLWNLEIEV